jgi:hypothetical protein
MKAQISLEFITFVSVLLLLMAVASFVAFSSSNETYKNTVGRDARSVAVVLAQEINIAVETGDGYSHNFSLPSQLYGGKNYSLVIENQEVFISWLNNTYSLPLLIRNTTGLPGAGTNLIKNKNGEIIFV